MRDPKRIDEVLAQVKKFWEIFPDWRFGQMVCNFQVFAKNDMYYMEDEDFCKFISHLLAEDED